CDGWMMSMPNANFEAAADGTAVPGWCTEGPDPKGVDRAAGVAYTMANDAYLESWSTAQWNALAQHVVVPTCATLELGAYVWTSTNVTAGYFGVRDRPAEVVRSETRFGPLTGWYQRLSVRFPSRCTAEDRLYPGPVTYTAFVGFWSPGGYSWVMVDDFTIGRVA
ncbi:hypothetical protein AB0G02_38555, partial [Actinosynnema sp. NPDC023658]|uniref:hypothetical protein n=1 Tax=Actinosynnema sp. NPDC023658 TaxID=3155465 RepID=UPI0033CF7D3A